MTPFDHVWTHVRASGAAAIPSPLPADAWSHLYTALDVLADELRGDDALAAEFDAAARAWQGESGLRDHYSGYFTPYYRDRVGQTDKDQKTIFQLCQPYYAYVYRRFPHLVQVPAFRALLQGTQAALSACERDLTALVESLSVVSPELADRLVHDSPVRPTALRLLSYVSDDHFFTNPHVDKSAVTVILHTDDPTDDPCLVVAGPSGRTLRLSDFYAPERAPDESLVFFGAAAQRVAPELTATPHGVRPPATPRRRHSAVFFWLLPGVDLAPFKTDIDYCDDLGTARPGHGRPRASCRSCKARTTASSPSRGCTSTM